MQEKIYHTSLVNLNYFEGPDNGSPLLLLHGGSLRWQAFEALIADFISDWHVYALDLRGHGKSGRARGYQLQDYVPDIVSFIQNCIQKPAIVFGHSLGGEIAIMTAASYPKVIKALIIGDSPLSLDIINQHRGMTKHWEFYRDLTRLESVNAIEVELKKMLMPIPGKNDFATASEIFGNNSPWFNFMAISLSQNDPNMLTGIIENYDSVFSEYDTEKLFCKIKCPTLIIRGMPELGSMITDVDIRRALKLLANGTEVQIPHVGHMLYMEDKNTVAKIMRLFMQSIDIKQTFSLCS